MDLFYDALLLLENLKSAFILMKIALSLKCLLLCSTEKGSHTGNNMKVKQNDDRMFIFSSELRLVIFFLRSGFDISWFLSASLTLSRILLLAFPSLFFSLHPCNFNGRTAQQLSPSFVSAAMIAPCIELGRMCVYVSEYPYHFHPRARDPTRSLIRICLLSNTQCRKQSCGEPSAQRRSIIEIIWTPFTLSHM